jgi:hypothetical protein
MYIIGISLFSVRVRIANERQDIQNKLQMLTTAQQSQMLRYEYISDICIIRKGTCKVTQLVGLEAATCFKNNRDRQREKITQQLNTKKSDPGTFRSSALELTKCNTVLLEI